MRIFSWNINGIRAVLKKGALQDFLSRKSPDILCLQETKAKKNQVEADFSDYVEYWNSAERPGYAGTAIFVKNGIKVLNSYKNFEKFSGQKVTPLEQMINNSKASTEALNPNETARDKVTSQLVKNSSETNELKIIEDEYGSPLDEGRILTIELEDFFVVTVYVPNSKHDLSRLNLRHDSFDPTFRKYLELLQNEKPVVVCGDFNAAHTEIDIARPKENEKNAGFTKEEREGIDNYLASGLVDTFRKLNPTARRYTWWSHWGKARENNVGWRIDYFLISKSLEKNLTHADIYENILGSDHCPISIELELSDTSRASINTTLKSLDNQTKTTSVPGSLNRPTKTTNISENSNDQQTKANDLGGENA